MKVQVFSDVHLDFEGYKPSKTDADVIVLAGDIAEGDLGVLWAREVFDVPVIYVAGNHEFYDSDFTIDETILQLKAAAKDSNIIVLDNEAVVISGVRFVGSTLWTDLSDAPDVLYSDGENINFSSGNRFDKQYAQSLFERNKAWLEQELSQSFDGKTVVITHHAPSLKSIHLEYEGNAWNNCFVSDLDCLFQADIDIWFHGHTHNSFNYLVNKTWVVCNPLGYYQGLGWENSKFNPECVIDLEQDLKCLNHNPENEEV